DSERYNADYALALELSEAFQTRVRYLVQSDVSRSYLRRQIAPGVLDRGLQLPAYLEGTPYFTDLLDEPDVASRAVFVEFAVPKSSRYDDGPHPVPLRIDAEAALASSAPKDESPEDGMYIGVDEEFLELTVQQRDVLRAREWLDVMKTIEGRQYVAERLLEQ